MLDQIEQFQKEATMLGRNANSVNEFILWLEAQNAAAMTQEAQDYISNKISKLHDEGYEGDQAIAMAYQYARDAGYDVPEAPKKSSVEEAGKWKVDVSRKRVRF